jgi:hypothetical protein
VVPRMARDRKIARFMENLPGMNEITMM